MDKSSKSESRIPSFLGSYVDFSQHIETCYGDSTNVLKGRKFASLVKDTLSAQDAFYGLIGETNERESHDEGVDLFWKDSEQKTDKIFCQSKFRIKSVDELDNVISKFKSFEEDKYESPEPKQLTFEAPNLSSDIFLSKDSTKYYIVTLWDLKNILKKYQSSRRPSLDFYKSLISKERLEIVDGPKLYEYFLDSYRREYSIPQEIKFISQQKLVNIGDVYVGIINAKDLISIYNDNGNGIFFENVRDFIGLGDKDSSSDINNEIFTTAKDYPDLMIQRNNGITFKASKIRYEENNVILSNAGIINGCQTTLCIVKANPSEKCYVPVKIVITLNEQNSTDIARTTNTQNRIDKINLELSDFIRPQFVKVSTVDIGIDLDDDEGSRSAPRVAASISKKKIFRSELRYLFIGLFSLNPRNIFYLDYAAIRFDDLKIEYNSFEDKSGLISLLARLIVSTNSCFESLRLEYPFDNKKNKRFFSP